MDAIAILKAKISANASRRIREASEDLTRPKILHTQYLGDRTVQQLGQEPVENAVILNNAANTIGDALMPLAKGQPLQRFDSVNQDDGVGTAKRSLLDNDANRNGSNFVTLRTGEQEPANDPLKGTPRGRDPLPKDYPPPFGCVPVGGGSKNCIWIPNATPPSGYQSHGSAVINEEGLGLWLHCKDGVVPPPDLGCAFLARWKCVDGVCYLDPNGIYSSLAQCQASLQWFAEIYTLGICRPGLPPNNCILDSPPPDTLVKSFTLSNAQYPLTISVDNRIPPGYTGFNHYKFVDALGTELDYFAASSAGYYATYTRICPT